MPLYEVKNKELVGFRLLKGADLYESEIEQLLWENLDDFTGESWFRVRRQAPIKAGGKPDILALDRSGRVVIIEVKRDIDRKQITQALEYAGWARRTSLDEIAGLYHRGADAFFHDWQEFTESESLAVINPNPQLVLVARAFHDRSADALDFLVSGNLAIRLVRVSIYEDADGRRLVDVEGEHEPDFGSPGEPATPGATLLEGRRVRIPDLIEADLLKVGDSLTWSRPRVGDTYKARINHSGAIELSDGRSFTSPSRAAIEAANIESYDGWHAWRVDRNQTLISELRRQLVEGTAAPDATPGESQD